MDVGEEGASIEQDTEKMTGSLPFDPDVVPSTADYQREVYGYHGHTLARGRYGFGGV